MRHLHRARGNPLLLKSIDRMMHPTSAALLARAHDLAERRYSGEWDMQPARLIDALHVIESERAILHAKDHAK